MKEVKQEKTSKATYEKDQIRCRKNRGWREKVTKLVQGILENWKRQIYAFFPGTSKGM